MQIALKPFGFRAQRELKDVMRVILLMLVLLTLSTGFFLVVFAEGDGIPMTGFAEFDAMYQYHMREEKPLVEDIMKPVNTIIFNLIEFQMRIVGTLLLYLCITAAAFSIWYVAKPEFADEVSEVKMRVANGEQIPVEEVKEFFLQFCPDIKANSGIADSYEYEKPTFGLFIRDHLLKFIILFAVAITLQQSVLISFIVKAGNALAFGAKYYTENTDFVGSVHTWTTAGKDFDPRFDTLTTEGRNKRKLFNAMYIAIKREFPRSRTEDFLQRVGAVALQKVNEIGPQLQLDADNFVVTADIAAYDVNQDATSPVMWRTKFKVSDFVGTGEIPVNGVDKTLYLSVLQYDQAESSSAQPKVITYPNSWKGGTPPTSLELGVTDINKDAPNAKFKSGVTKTVSVNVRYTDSNDIVQMISGQVTPIRTDSKLTINIATLINDNKITDKSKIIQIDITGMMDYSIEQDGVTKGAPAGSAYWYKR